MPGQTYSTPTYDIRKVDPDACVADATWDAADAARQAASAHAIAAKHPTDDDTRRAARRVQKHADAAAEVAKQAAEENKAERPNLRKIHACAGYAEHHRNQAAAIAKSMQENNRS